MSGGGSRDVDEEEELVSRRGWSVAIAPPVIWRGGDEESEHIVWREKEESS